MVRPTTSFQLRRTTIYHAQLDFFVRSFAEWNSSFDRFFRCDADGRSYEQADDSSHREPDEETDYETDRQSDGFSHDNILQYAV